MPLRIQRYSPSLCLLAALVLAQSPAAAEPPQSLAEKRLGVIKGTTSGIVLFEFAGDAPRAAAPVPAKPKPATSTGTEIAPSAVSKPSESRPTEAAAYEPPIGNRLFSNLPPPSGRSLQSARRLDAPDQGVPLRTGKDVTPAPSALAPKP